MPQNVNNSAVGAEAEVRSKSIYKKPFSIQFLDDVSTSEQRQIEMAFKAMYSTLVHTYLDTHERIRIHFSKEGRVVKVALLKNGQWMVLKSGAKEFSKNSIQLLSLNVEMTLLVKK